MSIITAYTPSAFELAARAGSIPRGLLFDPLVVPPAATPPATPPANPHRSSRRTLPRVVHSRPGTGQFGRHGHLMFLGEDDESHL